MFPAQYANFANMFNKSYADILPEHTQHNLAIEIENNKILPFDPMYGHSRLELEVLHDYINDILAKKFIKLFKSPSEVLVLFIKNKNREICLYIDF